MEELIKHHDERLFNEAFSQNGALTQPDEGNLQVRFYEEAHSNLGAITSKRGAL